MKARSMPQATVQNESKTDAQALAPASPTAMPARASRAVAVRTAAAPAPAPAPAPEPEPDAGAPPPPLYATRAPPPALLRYAVQRGAAQGEAELRWQPEAERYALTLQSRIAGLPALAWSSMGTLGAEGLRPERYVESRRGRERLATNFQRPPDGPGRITFSGPQVELPLPAGTQDRLSWTLQLAAALAADPALAQPGREVRVFVVGTRGDGEVWVFQVIGSEDLDLPAGRVAAALHLRRDAERPYDTQAEAWLDPARHHLPVRLRLAARPAAADTDFQLLALEMAPAAP